MRARTAADPHRLQERLTRYARARLQPALPGDPVVAAAADPALRTLELAFLAEERAAVAARARQAPTDSTAFVRWFRALERTGPGQHDPLFPWLAERATREELRWFLTQEVAGEAGFDDLVALTQLRLPPRAKLELARNYWDELGHGHERGMHGPMLAAVAEELQLPKDAEIAWEARAVGNLLAGLAFNREYAFHSLGALGAVELTARGRAEHVVRGLERIGVSTRGRRYYAVHAVIDRQHAKGWIAEVVAPLVDADPHVATAMAEGALMRLAAGARSFERYRRALSV